MTHQTQLNKVLEIKSNAVTGDVDMDTADFLSSKSTLLGNRIYLLVYKHHEVLIGEVRDGRIKLERPQELSVHYLKELRMFSSTGELYLWNRRGQLKYRFRMDNEGSETHRYDEEHFMWGNRADNKNDHAVIEVNRGMRITFPFPVCDNDLPLKYLVRNYLEFDKHNQVVFYDARLVAFLDKFGKEIPK